MNPKTPNHKVMYTGKDVMFFCPGCRSMHAVAVGDHSWNFNNDYEEPTIIGQMSIVVGRQFTDDSCHFFLHRGKLYFWPDTGKHRLRDKVVEMLPMKEWFKPNPEIKVLKGNAKRVYNDTIRYTPAARR